MKHETSCITIMFNFSYSLNELEKFIKVSGGGLAQDVEEGDYKGLVEVKRVHVWNRPGGFRQEELTMYK